VRAYRLCQVGICSVILLLQGCTFTKDLSNKPTIRKYFNARLTIKQRCLLCETPEAEQSFRGAPYQLYDYDPKSTSRRATGWIPKGTEITIRAVRYQQTFETIYINVLGTIYIRNEQPKAFWYSWKSYERPWAIKRAPWEDDSVSEVRLLDEL
jgi:hypothetical protein